MGHDMDSLPWVVGTGLSSAIGRALTHMLAGERCFVHVGRSQPEPGVQHIVADLRSAPEEWMGTVHEGLHRLGVDRIDGFVHLAGLGYSDRFEGTTAFEWDATLGVNLTAAFHLGQIISSRMSKGASLVLVGSVDAWHQSASGPSAAYGAAKAGLVGLMRQWAAEWGERDMRVNLVAPGALKSGMGPSSQEVAQDLTQRIALGRLGNPEEVASVVAFLLGTSSSYISGAVIPVDGGLNIRY